MPEPTLKLEVNLEHDSAILFLFGWIVYISNSADGFFGGGTIVTPWNKHLDWGFAKN